MAKKVDNKDKNIIIKNINVRPINRVPLDISKWHNAIKYSEGLTYNKKQLIEIYKQALLDGHLTSLMNKRIDAITNLELKFFDNDNKEVDEINTLINTSYFEKALKEIVASIFWGYTLLELDWSNREGYNNTTYSIDRRHIKPELHIVVRETSDMSGIDYLEHPLALFAGSSELGILAQACQYVIYKRNNTADWAEFNEVFGKPYPVGRYDNPDTAELLNEAFTQAGFDAYIIAPKDAEIDLKTTNSGTGSGDLFKSHRDAMNEEMSILILGQNLTTKVSGDGSYAATNSHHEVEESIHNSDREYTIKILNEKLIPILNRIGYNAVGQFRFVQADEMSLKDRIGVDAQLNNIIPINPDYFYETYGVPKGEQKTIKEEESPDDMQEDEQEQEQKLNFKQKVNFLHRLFGSKKKSPLAF